MDRLPAADKLILKMYYLDGLSYRSIADVLKVAPNTVSSYILRARDKLILKMYYLDGLSYRSIAGVMNVAPNTVSSYILRARDKLKKCIKEGTGGVS